MECTQSLWYPALSPLVQRYVKYVKEEQAKARVIPKQAKPIFASKLMTISIHIRDELQNTHISLRERYVLARDQAFFKLQVFAGDRASDLCNVLTQEVKQLPDGSGYVFYHTYGKTILGGSTKHNIFVVKRCFDQPLLCPIAALETYYAHAKMWNLQLLTGYIFRPVTEAGIVLDCPLSYNAIYERLKC